MPTTDIKQLKRSTHLLSHNFIHTQKDTNIKQISTTIGRPAKPNKTKTNQL